FPYINSEVGLNITWEDTLMSNYYYHNYGDCCNEIRVICKCYEVGVFHDYYHHDWNNHYHSRCGCSRCKRRRKRRRKFNCGCRGYRYICKAVKIKETLLIIS